MTKLARAMKAAEARKSAGIGGEPQEGIVFADSELQDRAVFSGFDIGFDELTGTSAAVADVYCQAARAVGLRSLFISSWCDGLLTGLMLASLPAGIGDAPEPGVTDDTGPEGCGRCIYCQHGQRCPWPDGPPEPEPA